MMLEGTVALVTGAARRVGKEIARELAHGGCDVALHFRNSNDEARELRDEILAKGRRACCLQGDLLLPEVWPRLVAQTVEHLGRLDILVNNAAVLTTPTSDSLQAESFDPALWDSTLRVNLVAPAGLCYYAQPYLAAGGRGKIINLCDISAERPWPNHLAYCCSKAGMVALTAALALAMAPKVQVNGISPGIAVFPESYSQETKARLAARVPLQREGSPGDVARLVRFLVEAGDYMTGQVIAVDGGRRLA